MRLGKKEQDTLTDSSLLSAQME